MTIEQRVVYIAFDGTPFLLEEKCKAYEEETKYTMYDKDGFSTTNVDRAYIVHFITESAAEAFINKSKIKNTPTRGLDENCWGWYYWDDITDCYYPIDKKSAATFLRVANSEKEGK